MKTNNQICNKYIYLVSFLHIHTKYLDLQACKKLAHGGVKAFDDHVYMCTSANVKNCIAIYIVKENVKICYTVQHIKVQDNIHLYHAMHILCIYWLK